MTRVLLVVPVLAATLLGCAGVNGDQQPTPIPTSVVAEKPTYTVARGDVVEKESVTGSVVLINPIALSFKVDGRLKSLDVHVGNAWKKDKAHAALGISDLSNS